RGPDADGFLRAPGRRRGRRAPVGGHRGRSAHGRARAVGRRPRAGVTPHRQARVPVARRRRGDRPPARRAGEGAGPEVTSSAPRRPDGAPEDWFGQSTTVTALTEPGAFGATIEQPWWVIRGPHGGFLAAVILRAMTS